MENSNKINITKLHSICCDIQLQAQQCENAEDKMKYSKDELRKAYAIIYNDSLNQLKLYFQKLSVYIESCHELHVESEKVTENTKI